jgi:hypothetical protein
VYHDGAEASFRPCDCETGGAAYVSDVAIAASGPGQSCGFIWNHKYVRCSKSGTTRGPARSDAWSALIADEVRKAVKLGIMGAASCGGTLSSEGKGGADVIGVAPEVLRLVSPTHENEWTVVSLPPLLMALSSHPGGYDVFVGSCTASVSFVSVVILLKSNAGHSVRTCVCLGRVRYMVVRQPFPEQIDVFGVTVSGDGL